MRRAARVDANHGDVVKAFKKLGCEVLSLASLGKGVPDLLVSAQGVNWLVEVKAPKGERNEAQEAFAERWKGGHSIVRDENGAAMVVAMMREWAVRRMT